MSFLNQLLLSGIAAATIPILIHLWSRRRFRRVPWAAMRFLTASVDRNRRRAKVEDLVLLAVRSALIALLALALARPALRHLPIAVPMAGSRPSMVIVIDNSASMETAAAAGGGTTRLDAAKAAARAMVEGWPPGSAVAVRTPFQVSGRAIDRASVLRWIDEVRPTDRYGDASSVLAGVVDALGEESSAEHEVWLVTDGQAVEWRRPSTGSPGEPGVERAAATEVGIVLVGDPVVGGNVAVRRVAPSPSVPVPGRPFRIDVDVGCFGDEAVVDVQLGLMVDGRPAAEPWMFDRIAPGATERATFHVRFADAGFHRVTAFLPGDAVPFDDRLSAVVRVVDEVRVLLVDGDSGPGNEAGRSETFFLEQALAPVAPGERDGHPVKPVVVPVEGLDGEDLESFEVVVLANVSDVAPSMADRIAAHVAGGGALIVFPGENVREAFYNTMLHARNGVVPALLTAPGAGSGDADPVTPRRMASGASGALGLDDDLLADAVIRRAFVLEPSPDRPARVVLRFDDGSPALVEADVGLGKVFLFASTADTAWTDFPTRPAFVPFVDRLLAAAVRHPDAGLELPAGAPLRRRMAPDMLGVEAAVQRLDAPEGEARGQVAAVVRDGGETVLRFDDVDRAGAYRVAFPGAGAAGFLFAVRPSGRESLPELLPPGELERLQPSARVIRWAPGDGTAAFMEGSRRSAELWRPLLVVVLAVAVLELVLAHRFSRAK